MKISMRMVGPLVWLLLLCMLAACNLPFAANAPTKSAQDLLSSSEKTMKQLHTEHEKMNMAMGSEIINLVAPPANASEAANTAQISINMKSDSDVMQPDQSKGNLMMSLTSGGQGIDYNTQEIKKNNKVYIQDGKGNWYYVDAKTAADANSNPFALSDQFTNFDDLLSSAQKGQLQDHGEQTLNGTSLRHLTSVLGSAQIQQVLNGSDTSTAATQFAHAISKGTIDFWIDDATSYIHRIDMKFVAKPPTNQQGQPPAATSTDLDPKTLEMTMDYSNFNSSLVINVPANAQATNSIIAVLQQQ